MRKDPLVTNEVYHIFNRSIAGYQIFSDDEDYLRIIELLNVYRYADFPCKFSHFSDLLPSNKLAVLKSLKEENNLLVEIIAYCIMPTHLHLILKQMSDDGISKFAQKVFDGYSKYFNIKHKRKGPLWEGHFNSVLVRKDEQLLHLSRYIHLNPVSLGLISKPEDWVYSSYKEYLSRYKESDMCYFRDLIGVPPKVYKKFVDDRISYQKELSLIKHLILEDYNG